MSFSDLDICGILEERRGYGVQSEKSENSTQYYLISFKYSKLPTLDGNELLGFRPWCVQRYHTQFGVGVIGAEKGNIL